MSDIGLPKGMSRDDAYIQGVADGEARKTSWLYYPGAEEGGVGESYMSDSHDGHYILRGSELIAAAYGKDSIVMAEFKDGLWYDKTAYGSGEGRPFVYIEMGDG